MADLNKKLKWVLFDVLQDISKKHGHDTVIYLPLDGSKGYTAKDLANGIVEETDIGQQYVDDLINIVIDLLRRRALAKQQVLSELPPHLPPQVHQKIPAHLLERAKVAREKAIAKKEERNASGSNPREIS